jgi:hypothetical protein
MWGLSNKWHNQPPPNFKRCMRCMWSQRAQNPIYLLTHCRRKSFIQNKTKVVNLGDNLDNVRPYQQRGRWNVNPATTNHYYLTLYRIELKIIRSRPFMHTLQIQVQLINTPLKVRHSTRVIKLQIISRNVKTAIHNYPRDVANIWYKQEWTKNRSLRNLTRYSLNRRFLTTRSQKLCLCTEIWPHQLTSTNLIVLGISQLAQQQPQHHHIKCLWKIQE